MNKNLKLAVILLCIFFAVFLFIFGSILPVLKSQAYIDASRNMSNVRTIGEFKSNFDAVFNFYSPVGGEESAKYLMSNIISTVSEQKNMSENVTRELIGYIEPKIYPDTRHYISIANLYTLSLARFKKLEDYNRAVEYYLKARQQGPKLPPVLYGLLSLYDARGDKDGIREIGSTILKYWPQDTRVGELLTSLDNPAKKK